jgi:hypothetical protein
MERTNILDGSNRWPKRWRTMPGMAQPAPSEADLRTLRLRYNAAYSAYQACLIAINEAAMSGQTASPELLKQEAAALRELNDARGNLIAAMAAMVKNH